MEGLKEDVTFEPKISEIWIFQAEVKVSFGLEQECDKAEWSMAIPP